MKFKPATKRDFEAYWGKSKLKDAQPPVLALAFKEIAKEAWEDGHEVGYSDGYDSGHDDGYDSGHDDGYDSCENGNRI